MEVTVTQNLPDNFLDDQGATADEGATADAFGAQVDAFGDILETGDIGDLTWMSMKKVRHHLSK